MIRWEDGRLRVSGRLTMGTAAALVDMGILPAGETRVVVDLAQVEAVDSAAVSLLLVWLRAALRNGVNLCFANVPENLLSLARLYGVADLLPLCGEDMRV